MNRGVPPRLALHESPRNACQAIEKLHKRDIPVGEWKDPTPDGGKRVSRCIYLWLSHLCGETIRGHPKITAHSAISFEKVDRAEPRPNSHIPTTSIWMRPAAASLMSALIS